MDEVILWVTGNLNEIAIAVSIIALVFSVAVFILDKQDSRRLTKGVREIRMDLGLDQPYNMLLEEWLALGDDQKKILLYLNENENVREMDSMNQKFLLAEPAIKDLRSREWLQEKDDLVLIPQDKQWFVNRQRMKT